MNISFPQILFQILNFGLLMGALTYLLYKPILQIFEKRAKHIAAGQKAADENIAESKKMEETLKKAQQDTKKEAVKLLDAAKKEAQAQQKIILADAKKEAEEMVVKAKKDWQAEKAQLTKELKKEMVKAVVTVTAKVLEKSLTKKDHTKLIDAEIDKVIKQL